MISTLILISTLNRNRFSVSSSLRLGVLFILSWAGSLSTLVVLQTIIRSPTLGYYHGWICPAFHKHLCHDLRNERRVKPAASSLVLCTCPRARCYWRNRVQVDLWGHLTTHYFGVFQSMAFYNSFHLLVTRFWKTTLYALLARGLSV